MSRAVAAVASLLAACAGSGPTAPSAPATVSPPAVVLAAPALRNPGFEDAAAAGARCPPRWECSAHNDVTSFRFSVSNEAVAAGSGSMCIERVGNEPWALATQAFHTTAMRGQRLRLSMAVRAQGLDGGAGPFIQSQGGRANAQKIVKSTRGWERVTVDLVVPGDSNLLVVGVIFEGGGKACFDDVRLELARA
jgi:hypothetical protein